MTATSTLLPYSFARKHGILFDASNPEHPILLLRPDADLQSLAEAQRAGFQPQELRRVSESDFNRQLGILYEGGSNTQLLNAETLGGELDLDDVARELSEPEDLLESDDDAPIIRLINALITEAIKENASDIHIEPFETRLSIRFRIDGVLREVLEPPRQVASLLVSCPRTGASPCASPVVRSTSACPRCPPGMANAWSCVCSTSRPAAWTWHSLAWRPMRNNACAS